MKRQGAGSELAGIAVIGMALRFPGAADPEQLWRNLVAGTDSVSRFSEEELAAGVPETLRRDPRYVAARGVVQGADLFDAAFFGLPPRQAELMDPQHRLFLECAREALDDAGYDPETYSGRIGLYAGASMNTYLLFNLLSNPSRLLSVSPFQTLLASDKDYLATRVS
ncbi:MAG TPA: polyketide synthase, partial [Thermoanaerobaculia bacterium]|nr:polyketide synthase [Thermoanaerobaculia bacterium]